MTGTDTGQQAPSSLLIAQLARGTRRRIEQGVAPIGLRPRELVALQHLREWGPSAQQALADMVGSDAPNLIAILNRPEDAGLAHRSRDRPRRRSAVVST